MKFTGKILPFTLSTMSRGLHRKPMFAEDVNTCTPFTNEGSLRNSKLFSIRNYPESNEESPQLKPNSLNPIYKHICLGLVSGWLPLGFQQNSVCISNLPPPPVCPMPHLSLIWSIIIVFVLTLYAICYTLPNTRAHFLLYWVVEVPQKTCHPVLW